MPTRLRVAAILVADDRVLLVSTRRGRSGYLVPPGGGVHDGEFLAEAVAREVREEAGLAVTPGPLLAYRELQTPGGSTLELYFAAQLVPGAVPGPNEGRTVRWLRLTDLPLTPHYPEQLAELCARAADPAAGALCLGRADLSAADWKEHATGE